MMTYVRAALMGLGITCLALGIALAPTASFAETKKKCAEVSSPCNATCPGDDHCHITSQDTCKCE